MEASLTFESAYDELKQITEEIESEDISVDALAAKVKRAAELAEFCQTKLRATEAEVNNIIQGMEAAAKKGGQ
jgi:exodeoxyribonuclease VII small subunit